MSATITELPGTSAELSFEVTESDLATALGSGDVPVLATPRLLAWLEATTVAAVAPALPAGSTSVGVAVELDHTAASPLGAVVRTAATVRHVEGRIILFEVDAVHLKPDQEPVVIGHGTVSRAVVDREKFLARLG